MYFFHHSIICALVSLFMFLYGFFILNYDGKDSLDEKFISSSKGTHQSVNKVVLMIIDGIRLDFVNAENMEINFPYVSTSSKFNQSCIFPCRVHLPTVTMPRVKALSVGTVPSFVDIALNFGSPRLTKDNIISQMVKARNKIVFYGDDTWIKLFPEMFSRYEGTNSFFVSDFVEVDVNVTRNVNEELKRDDWDVMILHYLGLDHIGHVEGSFSPKISEKLREMDAVIKKLNRYLLDWKQRTKSNYLMVICGDHGMKDAGGHGGSTLPEIMVPFITFGLPCSAQSEISQVDVAVTLSTLVGLPIPEGNVGKLIGGLMLHLTEAEKIGAYYRNSHQLMNKFMKVADEPSLFEADILFDKANGASKKRNYSQAILNYEILLKKMSETLIRSLTKYDEIVLYCAALLAVQSCFLVGIEYCSRSTVIYAVLLASLGICLRYEFCDHFRWDTMLCSSSTTVIIFSWFIVFILSLNTILLWNSARNLLRKCRSFFAIIFQDLILSFLIIGSMSHICGSASTSFIEEEHMIWYFLWTTLWILIGLRHHAKRRTVIILLSSLILHRILRKLNQTGDKWSALPDINDWFRRADNKNWLTLYTIFGLICTFFPLNGLVPLTNMRFRSSDISFQRIFKYIDVLCLTMVFNCRAAIDEVAFPEKFKFLLSNRGAFEFHAILVSQLISVFAKFILLSRSSRSSFKHISGIFISFFMVWSSLMLRPYNIILIGSLFAVSNWLGEVFRNAANQSTIMVITHHWLAQVFFFYQGNSNSFSSIDVTPGYIGQSHYNPVVAGILIIFSTYAMPILAYACLIRHLFILREESVKRRKFKSSIRYPASVLLFLTNLYLTVFMIIITVQRYHLFIWSVFSPKMIYLGVYNVLLYAVLIIVQFFFTD